MSIASPEHSSIAANTIGALKAALKDKSCQIFTSDVLIRVQTRSHYAYADVTVVCGRAEYEKIRTDRILTNPALLVEVLSPSTENYDRGTKFQLNKSITTFQDYLLIDSRQMYVQHYRKLDTNTWQEKTYNRTEQVIPLENFDISLTVADIYEMIEFEAEPEILS